MSVEDSASPRLRPAVSSPTALPSDPRRLCANVSIANCTEESAAASALCTKREWTGNAPTVSLRLAEVVREARAGQRALMLEFSLDSRESVALVCLAEALLRIPSAATSDRLIRDKIEPGDWQAHVGAVLLSSTQPRGSGPPRFN